MVTAQKLVLRDLLFELSDQTGSDSDDGRSLLHALVSEIEETESIDLHYSVSSDLRNLGDEQLLVLVKAMQDADLSRLQVLNLSGCFFEDQTAVRMLAELMESGSMSALRCLDLSGHYSLKEEGMSALSRALKCGKFLSLEHLGLPRCDFNNVMEAIEEGELKQMKNLIVSGTTMYKSSSASCSFANLLQTWQLRKLILMSLAIDLPGMADIIKALPNRPTSPLEHLDLSSNALGDEGCIALGRFLQSGDLSGLQRLRLYSCSISSQQLKILCQALESSQTSSSVRHLDLSWNNFGDEGALALASVIQGGHLSGLRRLNLGHCGIRSRGIVALLEALGMASMLHLEWLNLLGNRIGEEGANAVAGSIAGMLDMVPRLEIVNLVDGRQGNPALLQALKGVVLQQDPHSKFTAGRCGLKRKVRLPFWQD